MLYKSQRNYRCSLQCNHLVFRVEDELGQTPVTIGTGSVHLLTLSCGSGAMFMAIIFICDNHNYEKMLQKINCAIFYCS